MILNHGPYIKNESISNTISTKSTIYHDEHEDEHHDDEDEHHEDEDGHEDGHEDHGHAT